MRQKRTAWIEDGLLVPVRSVQRRGDAYRVEIAPMVLTIRPDDIAETLLEAGGRITGVEFGKLHNRIGIELETDIPYAGYDDDFLRDALRDRRWFELGEMNWRLSRHKIELATRIANRALIGVVEKRYFFFSRDRKSYFCYRGDCVNRLVEKIREQSELIETPPSKHLIVPRTEVAERLLNHLAVSKCPWKLLTRLVRARTLEDALATLLAARL